MLAVTTFSVIRYVEKRKGVIEDYDEHFRTIIWIYQTLCQCFCVCELVTRHKINLMAHNQHLKNN